MASNIFLDTNGWLALLNATDALHQQADETWRDIGSGSDRIVLTDWIIAETGNGLARLRERAAFDAAAHRILASPRVDIIFVDDDLLKQSLEHYSRHSDKSWGLVDCASFVVMQDRNITEAFTSDRHFQQAGFHCLLTA